jgi:hypothetical protein
MEYAIALTLLAVTLLFGTRKLKPIRVKGRK